MRNWLDRCCLQYVHLYSRPTSRAMSKGRSPIQRRFCNPSSIEEHHLGCAIMLAHFHYLNKGVEVFSLACNPGGHQIQELMKVAELKEDQLRVVTTVAEMLKAKGEAVFYANAFPRLQEWQRVRSAGSGRRTIRIMATTTTASHSYSTGTGGRHS